MLHLIKLAVGVTTVAEVAERQRKRAQTDPPLRQQTRVTPKRAAEIASGGSIYWVIADFVQVRQRILAIRPDVWDDGSASCALELDPEHVPVEPRAVKPFQGWRYLAPGDAQRDRRRGFAAPETGVATMPAEMRQKLAALGLL